MEEQVLASTVNRQAAGEGMTWFVVGASLLATWLDPRRIRACFAIWFLTYVTWAVRDFTHRLPAPPNRPTDRPTSRRRQAYEASR